MENCRKKVIKLMRKYSSYSIHLIPLETVQMEIEKLKREECYLDPRKESELMKYLFDELPGDDIALLDSYEEITNYFHLPKNEQFTELHHAPVQGMRLSLLLGWIIQFIGPIDKDNELLANVLVSNLEFAIEKDIEKTVAFIRDEPYGAQEDNHNQSKYEKMAEKARLRKLAVQQKKNKKGGKQKLGKENKENYVALESKWKDLSDEPIEFSESKREEDIRRSIVTIKGRRYGSNYSLLKNGLRKENPQKFFLIDIDELQKFMDMESIMCFQWTQDEKYLEDLESFVNLTGIKKFVLRSFKEDRADSKRFFQFEEAVEITRICLELKGADPNMHGMLDAVGAEKLSLNEHVRKSRSMGEIETMFYMHHIDKSNITVIPDFVEKLSEIHSNENIYTPITTIGRNGEDLMKMGESALYLFKNLICGVDWLEAFKTNGIDLFRNFRNGFEDTLMPLFCEWEACYVYKDWHDNIIAQLKNHRIFEKQIRTDINFSKGFSKGSLITTSYFSWRKEKC
ncbi:unnamed protein product [Caenorhabditis nigoni]